MTDTSKISQNILLNWKQVKIDFRKKTSLVLSWFYLNKTANGFDDFTPTFDEFVIYPRLNNAKATQLLS